MLEDFSVVSENSANLVSMGSKFRQSDELSDSDLESNRSSLLYLKNPNGLALRIRQAFNRMYEFIEADGFDNVPPSSSVTPTELRPGRKENQESANHVREGVPKIRSEVTLKKHNKQGPKQGLKPGQKAGVEVFKPTQSASSEETLGILKIDPGTLLLPSDDIYINEFITSKDESETSIPIMYQFDDCLVSGQQGQRGKLPAVHPGVAPADGGPPDSLPTPIPLKKDPRRVYSRSEPILSSSASWTSESAKVPKPNSKIQVDILREDKSDNDFRIVGLAYNSTPSETSRAESDSSYPSDEGAQKSGSGQPGFVRSMLSPSTFEKLSKELDDMVGLSNIPQIAPRANPRTGPMISPRPAGRQKRAPTPAPLHSLSSDYKVVSVISQSTMSTLSNSTPITNNSRHTPKQNTYTIDVLGEACPASVSPRSQPYIPRSVDPPRSTIPHSLATGSWQSEFGGSNASGGRSDALTTVSRASRDGVEAMLTEDGAVALRTVRSSTKPLRKLV